MLPLLRRYAPLALLLTLMVGVSAQDTILTHPVAPGVEHTSLRRAEGPWEVRVVRIERAEELVRLEAALGGGVLRGVEALSGIIRRETRDDDYVVAAVNADFFVMAGHRNAGIVTGMMVRNGELVMTARNRPAFMVMADGALRIATLNTTGLLLTPHGSAHLNAINHDPGDDTAALRTAVSGWSVDGGCVVVRLEGLPLTPNGEWRGTVTEIVPAGEVRQAVGDEVLLTGAGAAGELVGRLAVGDEVTISIETPGLEEPVALAVGGGPVLIREGNLQMGPSANDPRHPRTAVGFNEREIILVTVDGRQGRWSVGMSMHELALLMQELGCTDAVNLDGGGSSTAWVRGAVVNRPSDGGERRIANALLLRSRAPRGPLARLSVAPDTIVAFPGARIPLTIRATDEWHNPVEADLAQLRAAVELPPGQEEISAEYEEACLAVRGAAGDATALLRHPEFPEAEGRVRLRLVTGLARLEVTPPLSHALPDETVRLTARGLTEDGAEVALPADEVQWSAEGDAVESLGAGRFRAVRPGASATVTARLAGVAAEARIGVAADVQIEGFEAAPAIRFTRFPDTDAISGSVEIIGNGAPDGAHFARLRYDLGKPEGTRAAYLRLDRNVGAALRVSLLARGSGAPPAWLRAALVDGSGSRHLVTLSERVDWTEEWRRVEARLPHGIRPPVRWESVYVAATAGRLSVGHVDLDDLRVLQAPE